MLWKTTRVEGVFVFYRYVTDYQLRTSQGAMEMWTGSRSRVVSWWETLLLSSFLLTKFSSWVGGLGCPFLAVIWGCSQHWKPPTILAVGPIHFTPPATRLSPSDVLFCDQSENSAPKGLVGFGQAHLHVFPVLRSANLVPQLYLQKPLLNDEKKVYVHLEFCQGYKWPRGHVVTHRTSCGHTGRTAIPALKKV